MTATPVAARDAPAGGFGANPRARTRLYRDGTSEYMLNKNPGLKPGSFDLVLTNPPFGSVIKRTEKCASCHGEKGVGERCARQTLGPMRADSAHERDYLANQWCCRCPAHEHEQLHQRRRNDWLL